MKIVKALFVSFGLSLGNVALADEINIGGQWGGLNNSDQNALSSADTQSSDLLNVEVAKDGASIMKRGRIAFQQNLNASSTQSITGIYRFERASDGRYVGILAGGGSIYAATSDNNSFGGSAVVSTDTLGAFYDFADNAGFLWRANSEHDEILKYDGNATVTYYPAIPRGDQIEFLPDRMVVSGSTANPSVVNFSGAADFTNFTTGTGESDPFTESFGVGNNRVTAMKWFCEKLFVFTNGRTYSWNGTNQFDGRIQEEFKELGTFQPQTVQVRDDVMYFQGNDLNVYSFDCSVLRNVSKNIRKLWLGVPPDFTAQARHGATIDHDGRYWLGVLDSIPSVPNYLSTTQVSSYTFVYDPKFDFWTRFNFASHAYFSPARGYSSGLDFVYFGGKSTHTLFNYVDSREIQDSLSPLGMLNDQMCSGGCATAITAYWKSKNFTTPSPYLEKNFLNYSVIASSNSGSNIDFTWTVNTSSSVVRNISLTADATGSSIRRINHHFPSGTSGTFFNFKFGNDDLNAPFRIYAVMIELLPKLWRVF